MYWIKRIRQNICNHVEENLVLNVIEYNTSEISCTAVDHEIVCGRCGKVFVPANRFDGVVELLRKSRYLQTPPPSSHNSDCAKSPSLEDIKNALVDMKRVDHHTISEEWWRIEKVLEKIGNFA